MRLREMLADCMFDKVVENQKERAIGTDGMPDIEILGISYDSRKVREGDIFVAIKGGNFDGHDFINDAVRMDAAAIVYEKTAGGDKTQAMIKEIISSPVVSRHRPVFIPAADTRDALACLSNNFFRRPSENASVIGVTGTNGKTTTTYIVKSILEAEDKHVGLIGTIQHIIKDRGYYSDHTTPESLEFQGLLHKMVLSGCSHVVAEVSSHSLAQKRVDHTKFAVAVFTNLTRDHLDFHGTMEEYYAAKERLFNELLSEKGTAVINTDDGWGDRLCREMKRRSDEREMSGPSILTYGIERDADIMAVSIESSFSGLSFDIRQKDRDTIRIESPLLGMTNVYNILAAASAALSMDVAVGAVRKGIRDMQAVAGRFERIDAGQDFLCIVDYAHTPDALERLISTARALVQAGGRPSRIITVFGCGGNRDRGKRPLMGGIAVRMSDFAIITSDNPRNEEPEAIIKDIESGISGGNYQTIIDRREAIRAAIEQAGSEDIVLIAGKGHEDYQEIRGIKHKFSDREVAEEAIRNKTARGKRD